LILRARRARKIKNFRKIGEGIGTSEGYGTSFHNPHLYFTQMKWVTYHRSVQKFKVERPRSGRFTLISGQV